MNWEAIGAVAELLGAIGVIASLIYLATQIVLLSSSRLHGRGHRSIMAGSRY